MPGKKTVIVGGVAGGASFAARVRRLDESARIIMLDKGEHVSFANCGLPYHIGGTIADRDRLIVQTPEGFKDRFNVEVRTLSEVLRVNTQKRTVTIAAGGTTYDETYDVLLLSPGAQPIRPNILGIASKRVHTLRTLSDMDRIISRLDNGGTRAVVIGGGFIGLETAENLRHKGVDVTLVELSDQVFTPMDKEMADILHGHLNMNGVQLVLGDGAERFEEYASDIVTVLSSGKTIVPILWCLPWG